MKSFLNHELKLIVKNMSSKVTIKVKKFLFIKINSKKL